HAAAVWDGRVRVDRALVTARAGGTSIGLADVVELERAGLARRDGDVLAIDRATADAALALASTDEIAALARIGLAAADDASAQPVAPLRERVAMEGPRPRQTCDVAEQLLAGGYGERARRLAMRALAFEPARAGLIAARAAAATGAYAEVEELAVAAQ